VSAAFAIVFARVQCNIIHDGASDEVKREAKSAAPATVMSDAISKYHWETGKAEREGLRARRPAVT
jgi:hypothetical protein